MTSNDLPSAASSSSSHEASYEVVLTFWFGKLDKSGLAAAETVQRWWKKDATFDAEIVRRFAPLYEEIVAGQHDGWLATSRGLLGAVIVLDQMSRNMFRNTARMYAADDQALRYASDAIKLEWDTGLAVDERAFLYLPLMHSEELAVQDRCVALFAALRDQLQGPAKERVSQNHKFAVEHRDIVARFGRFPHRNEILERTSTDEEIAFLKEPGSSF